MKIIGKTEDNFLVVADVFEFFDTLGLPLEDIIIQLKNKNMLIDWIDFYKQSKKAGWLVDTFYEKLIVLEDIFDKKYKEEVLKRISLYIEYYEK